ncbi:MAG TPA: pyrroline-5-carboxylate reductase [Bacteroidia bacterium]|jgi:pyrroline-5-carboxylate reductase|nr:pyrroline-5-carboxylate reductase [Bacteroidia bacterium]
MKIAIVGCGNMGLAYANSFVKYNLVSHEELLLVEKGDARKQQLEKLSIGKVVSHFDNTIAQYDIIIVAVKPQDFPSIAEGLKNSLTDKNIVLSIMAGKQIKYLEEALAHNCIVRAMPNSPAQLGMGMTAFSSGKGISMEQLRKVENLLGSTGRTVFLEDENLLDAITALSGSGPAYFFYIVKHMIDAGVKMGIEPATSAMLVKQTMLGSFHLLNSTTNSLDELITAVKSKGGTTEAALKKFEEGKLGETLINGILDAERRAKELSKT